MNVPQEFFATTIKELPDKNFGIGGKTIDKSLNPTTSTLHHARDVVSVNALRDASIRMIQILQLIKLLPQI